MLKLLKYFVSSLRDSSELSIWKMKIKSHSLKKIFFRHENEKEKIHDDNGDKLVTNKL